MMSVVVVKRIFLFPTLASRSEVPSGGVHTPTLARRIIVPMVVTQSNASGLLISVMMLCIIHISLQKRHVRFQLLLFLFLLNLLVLGLKMIACIRQRTGDWAIFCNLRVVVSNHIQS